MASEPDKPKPKRRFWQCSLRTLFALLTVSSVCFGWFGWKVHRANEQKKAKEWVGKIGGATWYDYEFDENGRPIDDPVPPGPKWLVELLGVEFFNEVSGVMFGKQEVSDLNPLVKLTSLKELWLRNTQVSTTALGFNARLNLIACCVESYGQTQPSSC